MPRQITKHPKGPATPATPKPPKKARSIKSSITEEFTAEILTVSYVIVQAIFMQFRKGYHPTVSIVVMVMMMVIQC